MTDQAKLFAKIAQAQADLGDLPRDKSVDAGRYKYDYVSEDAITKAVRKHLTPLGVATFVSYPERWNDEDDITCVRCEITFACTETGATFTVSSLGYGSGGDKALNKAMTSALRVGLTKTFLQAGDDDGEHENNPRKARRSASTRTAAAADAPATWRVRLDEAVKIAGSEDAVKRAMADENGEVPSATTLGDDDVWKGVLARLRSQEPSDVIRTRVQTK